MNSKHQNGFTLIEILISLVMSSVVVVSLYNISKVHQDTYVAQDQVVAMQQNLRAAMLLPIKEIRMAGYDPSSNSGATIISATVDTLHFTSDLDGNGDTSGTNEDVTYSLYTTDGIQKFGRKQPILNRPVAEYINNIEFYYTMADSTKTLTPANPKEIRAVQVTVLAQSISADPKITTTRSYTTPSGVTWTLPVGYKGRMETMSVQCRNMGLQ